MQTPLYIRFLAVSLLLSVLPFFGISQCNVTNTTFKSGEKITYKAVYNWGLIWVDAGQVVFEVQDAVYDNKEVFYFKSSGTSFTKYDWFFKVRDYFEAYSSKTDLRPYKHVRNTLEGGYKVNNRYFFNYDKKQVYTFSENSKKPLVKDTFTITPCLFDLVTAIYYVRCYDYSKTKINEKIPLHLIVDNELVNLYVRYMGVEVIEHPTTEKKYSCLKFKAKLMEGTIFSGGEDVTVWVSNDKNKIPILIEAKILVGSVKAVLDDYSGLRHPFSSLVE